MKPIKIIKTSLWLILIAGILVLVSFINVEHRKTTCKEIEIDIDYDGGEPLIIPEQIKSRLRPDTLIGKKLTDIDLVKIEKKINSIPLLSKADAYTSITGSLNIHARQCHPIVRVFTSSNKSYYFDQNGDVIPVSTNYPSRVLVASGNIRFSYSDTLNVNDLKEKSLMNDLFKLSEYIYNDRFLKAQIDQIYVNRFKEFELVPKVGKHLIVLGNLDKLDNKFERLMKFYEEGLNKTDWNKYKVINLKFDNQVVCTKR
jgi:cell division protein FtsQ